MPPSVPKALVPLLRPLPDACPLCNAIDFNIVLGDEQAWKVLCAECGGEPGSRPGAD